MAHNGKIRIIAAIVLALLMILLSGTAVAQSKISNRLETNRLETI